VAVAAIVVAVILTGKKPAEKAEAPPPQQVTTAPVQQQQVTPPPATTTPPPKPETAAPKPTAEAKPAPTPEQPKPGQEKLATVDDLIKQLSSDDFAAQADAVDGLVLYGAAAVPALCKAVSTIESPIGRRFAIQALGMIRSSAATETLIKALKDEDPKVREEAAKSLGKFGPGARKAIEPLIEALADENLDVRYAASDALEEIGSHVEPDADDYIEGDVKQLQKKWRDWLAAGAKPDTAGYKATPKGEVKMHTHMHVHVDGTRHSHPHPAAEHEPGFDISSGLMHHGYQPGMPTGTGEEEQKK